jgi:tetratricopeptide (TPR) repeat protein
MRAVTCSACGAKVRADRDRCPRCHETLAVAAPPDPAIAAARSKRLQKMTAAICGVFVLAMAILWLRQGPAPAASAARAAADPLSSRRQATPATPAAAPEAPAQERTFYEPAAAGAVAYGTGDYAAALARYQAAVGQNPQDAESWSNLGQILVRMNRLPEAIAALEKAIAILPDRWAYQFNLARAQGLSGDWKAAIATYRRAQALFPDDYATTFNLALACHKAGNEAAAVVEYEKAIRLAPEDASFRMAFAISLEKLGRARDAAAAYGEYLRLSPSAPDADKVRTRIAELSASPGPAAGSSSQH